MNEEAKELPQSPAPEAVPQQQSSEVAQPTEAQAENPTAIVTPNKSITETKRSFWDKLFKRNNPQSEAVAAPVAPAANPEIQDQPLTPNDQPEQPSEPASEAASSPESAMAAPQEMLQTEEVTTAPEQNINNFAQKIAQENAESKDAPPAETTMTEPSPKP